MPKINSGIFSNGGIGNHIQAGKTMFGTMRGSIKEGTIEGFDCLRK